MSNPRIPSTNSRLGSQLMESSNLQYTTTTHTTYMERTQKSFRTIMHSGNSNDKKLSTSSYNRPYTNAFAREFPAENISTYKTPSSSEMKSILPTSLKLPENDTLLKGRSAVPFTLGNSTPRITHSIPVSRPINSFSTTQNAAVNRPIGTVPRVPYQNKSSQPQLTGEKIKIVVKKGKSIPMHPNVPMYKTDGRNRGRVLIINNIMFDKKDQYRKGAEVDESNLKKLFDKMGFKVRTLQNLRANQMKTTLSNYSKSSDLKSIDISIIIMMSHGHGQVDGSTYIMGVDDQPLNIADIVDTFNNVNCPLLINKPKIFIFQCCRGGDSMILLGTQIVQNDAAKFNPVKKLSDILIAYSTIPGYVSNRNPVFGTWYISSICKVFMEHAWNTHVEDLLKMVDVELTKLSQYVGQTSNYDNRGFKICYLNPK